MQHPLGRTKAMDVQELLSVRNGAETPKGFPTSLQCDCVGTGCLPMQPVDPFGMEIGIGIRTSTGSVLRMGPEAAAGLGVGLESGFGSAMQGQGWAAGSAAVFPSLE